MTERKLHGMEYLYRVAGRLRPGGRHLGVEGDQPRPTEALANYKEKKAPELPSFAGDTASCGPGGGEHVEDDDDNNDPFAVRTADAAAGADADAADAADAEVDEAQLFGGEGEVGGGARATARARLMARLMARPRPRARPRARSGQAAADGEAGGEADARRGRRRRRGRGRGGIHLPEVARSPEHGRARRLLCAEATARTVDLVEPRGYGEGLERQVVGDRGGEDVQDYGAKWLPTAGIDDASVMYVAELFDRRLDRGIEDADAPQAARRRAHEESQSRGAHGRCARS